MSPGPPSEAAAAVALTADDWGRMIALLCARDGDIAGAEDALADAVESALRAWPASGVPRNPRGWVYRAALNARRDVWRSAAARTSVPLDARAHDAAADPDPALAFSELPDARLQLLAACADPAVNPASRPLLMLSTVMGLPARRIAEGMILPAATVSARLTRAKKRIRASGRSMRIPDRSELPERLLAIHEGIYGVFTVEWAHAERDLRHGLIAEAVFLAELVAELCPDDGESHGLAALIDLSSARFAARRSGGDLVPLHAQDSRRWDSARVEAGEAHLREVLRCGHIGRFGLEAVIQALHMQGVRTGRTDWDALLRQHDHLLRIAPSLGAQVSRAAVLQQARGPQAALHALDELPRSAGAYQPAWVVRAHALRALGHSFDADSALERAISLTTVASERRHLERERRHPPGAQPGPIQAEP